MIITFLSVFMLAAVVATSITNAVAEEFVEVALSAESGTADFVSPQWRLASDDSRSYDADADDSVRGGHENQEYSRDFFRHTLYPGILVMKRNARGNTYGVQIYVATREICDRRPDLCKYSVWVTVEIDKMVAMIT